jgi:hypothetical protein
MHSHSTIVGVITMLMGNELSNIEFPNMELVIVLTDDSIKVKEKRIIYCKLYTVKSAQVIPFRPRLFQ